MGISTVIVFQVFVILAFVAGLTVGWGVSDLNDRKEGNNANSK